MTEFQVAVTKVIDGKASYRVYMTETGIDRTYIGPEWPTPRQAADYADLRALRVSPLRAEDPTTQAASPSGN